MKDIRLNDILTDLEAPLEAIDGEVQLMAMLSHSVSGEWKASPMDGLGVADYMGAPEREMRGLRNKAQEAMERNGIKGRVKVAGGAVNIDIE